MRKKGRKSYSIQQKISQYLFSIFSTILSLQISLSLLSVVQRNKKKENSKFPSTKIETKRRFFCLFLSPRKKKEWNTKGIENFPIYFLYWRVRHTHSRRRRSNSIDNRTNREKRRIFSLSIYSFCHLGLSLEHTKKIRVCDIFSCVCKKNYFFWYKIYSHNIHATQERTLKRVTTERMLWFSFFQFFQLRTTSNTRTNELYEEKTPKTENWILLRSSREAKVVALLAKVAGKEITLSLVYVVLFIC